MKNLLKNAIALLVICALAGNASAQTLKERIDEAKTVKVYFIIKDIVHSPNTTPAPGSQQKGTGCPLFSQTTAFPSDYQDEVKQVVDMLNKGFSTTAFVAGDISTVPVLESGMLKGSPDWLKLGEPVMFSVSLTGSYLVNNTGLMGDVKLTANMQIISAISVYAPVSGKIKTLTTKNLGTITAPFKDSKTCPDYDYFVKNFPLADYFSKFKESFESKTNDFITKEMESYTKAMSKKK